MNVSLAKAPFQINTLSETLNHVCMLANIDVPWVTKSCTRATARVASQSLSMVAASFLGCLVLDLLWKNLLFEQTHVNWEHVQWHNERGCLA
jgi:hypothetical protein